MLDYLHTTETMNKTMRLWLSAVCSLCFYGMCRINEVLLMKKADVQFGLQRKSMVDGTLNVHYGCFTIRDRVGGSHDLSRTNWVSTVFEPQRVQPVELVELFNC
jgi:hypothetical protein